MWSPGASPAIRRTCRSSTSWAARRGSSGSTRASRCRPRTAAPSGCSCRTCTSGRARSGSAASGCSTTTSPASGRSAATTSSATRGGSRGTTVTEGSPSLPSLPPLPTLGDLPPLPSIGPVTRRVPPGGARREWQTGEVVAVRDETARARTLRLWLPKGHPHVAGQHYVVRVTDDVGVQMQRSYSVASAPEVGPGGADATGTHIELTVDRLDDGFVSPILHDEVGVGDPLEVRG